ncbi:putative zinc transporter msc2 [Aspergillus nanangensis]|uniref:Zinc transporter msc2 n=1 Tax=Aspergillus nanangensis TaxID=2582783 RepID=A0AAD4CQ60_ASPNN|nr:putative zinc transporter msc2 [Aspergillus nanangensis]
MCVLRKDPPSLPYSWYWQGKSLHIGEKRVECIRRVCTGSQASPARQNECSSKSHRVEGKQHHHHHHQHSHKVSYEAHKPKETNTTNKNEGPKCSHKHPDKGCQRNGAVNAKHHQHRSSSTHQCKHYSETKERREVKFREEKYKDGHHHSGHSHSHSHSHSHTHGHGHAHGPCVHSSGKDTRQCSVKHQGHAGDHSGRHHRGSCCPHHKH